MAGPATLAPNRPATDLLSLLRLGRANARTAAELAEHTGTSERAVRKNVEWLRRNGHLVGSTTRPGGGYYIAATYAEAEEVARQLRSRALAMLQTKRAMERTAVEQFGERALRLFDLEEVAS